ncbi:hypothetical protein PGB28_14165 [Primorskyibacter aestuariivivens]|uniref:sulfotransferase n=1 Tax=Primorskyibacter aestuariivivens TaxID=1888912 RepID=UPI002300B161|nr:sulfotransferase [Primorskyibacter aestuariivivens]MDA7429611.1 hypothetical protein [Primorskyibacter aestuariivivens]
MRKLDFIVFGLARSGTTALTNLIRANQRIFCGAEFFTPRMDHSKIDVPKAFFDEEARLEKAGNVPQNIRVSMEVLRSRSPDTIEIYGNKWPLYSHFFDRIMSETGARKAIMTYRNYRACARSYRRRSEDPNDVWPDGRRGVFAGVEMMHVLKILARTEHTNTLILPQVRMAQNWRGALDDVSDYLLPGKAYDVDESVISRLEASRKSARAHKPVPLPKLDQPVFEMFDDAGVNDIFPSDRSVYLGDIQDDIRAAVKKLPDDHIAFCQNLIESFDDPKVNAYFQTWRNIATGSQDA